MTDISELEQECERLTAELAQARAGMTQYVHITDALNDTIEQLEAEVESYRICGGCKHIGIENYEDENGFIVDLLVCDSVDVADPIRFMDVDFTDHCLFTPSRWVKREAHD